MAEAQNGELKKLLLDALWRAGSSNFGGAKKFGGFAGYDMPLEFEGLIAEHNWTRTHAGLFDVSHMGPCLLEISDGLGEQGAHERIAAIMERLVSADLKRLEAGQARLTVLLNQDGGVLDDLMITRPARETARGGLYIVVNAGTKEQDFALIAANAGSEARLRRLDDRALLALQGPEAVTALSRIVPGVEAMSFMTGTRFDHPEFAALTIHRSGYTGEDGFEILVTPENAQAFAEVLLNQTEVKPIGLGARDSLRLE
ncbi:MAG: glycine cleavage system protein T, partial [Caulobacterales bacterium]